MKKKSFPKHHNENSSITGVHLERENNWCEKYGYFIDLDACAARSLIRPACRRCYKSLLQLSLPFSE